MGETEACSVEASPPSRPATVLRASKTRCAQRLVTSQRHRDSLGYPSRVGPFDDLARTKTVVITTYKRDGTAVPTPVNVIVDNDHAYFRTWTTAGKAKRLRQDPSVLVAPSTFRGKPIGPELAATARLLTPDEEQPVRKALARKYPLLQGQLVPMVHRLRRYHTVHYELTVRPIRQQDEARD